MKKMLLATFALLVMSQYVNAMTEEEKEAATVTPQDLHSKIAGFKALQNKALGRRSTSPLRPKRARQQPVKEESAQEDNSAQKADVQSRMMGFQALQKKALGLRDRK